MHDSHDIRSNLVNLAMNEPLQVVRPRGSIGLLSRSNSMMSPVVTSAGAMLRDSR